ncbi:hypothetical protein G9A89_000785 [Geosiphon pyriformis]|nr:hypothetical protein G9A89_000785 [Geosiphon pyriformis]
MAYAPIAKLEKFTSKENDVQIWLNNIEKAITANEWNNTRAMQVISYFLQNTANSWYQNLVNKLQDFNAFKIEFLRYFSNNNSINRLANTFITIKQRETIAVTTYLGHFHRNLYQIQVINANYFTVAQILNQFIRKLCSSILQHNPETGHTQNPNFQYYLSLLVSPKNVQPNNLETNQQSTLTNNIPPTTITKNKLLDAIFQFELEKPSTILLFSGATLEKKPITAMYTDAKVDGHSIKLILNSRSAGSIITRQLMDQLGCQVDCTASAKIITADGATKTSIGKINNFPFEVNGIMIPIKVLVMEATQYKALVGNNWLFKTNTTLNWITQEL